LLLDAGFEFIKNWDEESLQQSPDLE
jgi:hypothetical protein